MASALDLAGADKPEFIEFDSFIDIATGKASKSNYHEIYGCYTDAQRMIRKDGYKLIVYPKIEVTRLFNLKEDPLEINDISYNDKYMTIKKSLFNDLILLQEQMQDTVDIKNTFPTLVSNNR